MRTAKWPRKFEIGVAKIKFPLAIKHRKCCLDTSYPSYLAYFLALPGATHCAMCPSPPQRKKKGDVRSWQLIHEPQLIVLGASICLYLKTNVVAVFVIVIVTVIDMTIVIFIVIVSFVLVAIASLSLYPTPSSTSNLFVIVIVLINFIVNIMFDVVVANSLVFVSFCHIDRSHRCYRNCYRVNIVLVVGIVVGRFVVKRCIVIIRVLALILIAIRQHYYYSSIIIIFVVAINDIVTFIVIVLNKFTWSSSLLLSGHGCWNLLNISILIEMFIVNVVIMIVIVVVNIIIFLMIWGIVILISVIIVTPYNSLIKCVDFLFTYFWPKWLFTASCTFPTSVCICCWLLGYW